MILALGISHKTAPIDVREKLAFSPEHIPSALKALTDELALDEVLILSTCNRTEFYCSAPAKTPLSINQMMAWWYRYHAPAFDITPYLYTFSNEFAVKHVMRVACGLDSMMLGEPQILGQLKSAYRTANETGVVGKRLSRLLQTSFSVAKKIRTTTGIAAHPVSIAFAAVTLARQIFSDLSQATVLLLGAGENTELVLQHLLAKQVKNLIIMNRTLSHAKKLATRYEASALPLTELHGALAQADIVISSITSTQPLVTQTLVNEALKGTKRRPILMVDLGLPRNVESSVGQNEDVYLYTIDDLQGIVDENIKNRQVAVKDAEKMISFASNAYMDWIAMQQHMQTVRALRKKADHIKNVSLAQAIRLLDQGQDPKEVLRQTAHQLTQKLMHEPTMSLRKMTQDKSSEKIRIVKELFSIE